MKRFIPHKPFTRSRATLKPDYVLMAALGLIVLFGLLFLASASSVYSYKKFGSAYSVVFKQILLGVLPGTAVFFFFSYFDYRRLARLTYTYFAVTLGFLSLVFLPQFAAEYGRTRSWIEVLGFSFQPAEAAKLTFLLFLASWMVKKGYQALISIQTGVLPFVLYLGVVSFLVLKQPDLGTLMIIVCMAVAVYFVAGARLRHLAALGLAGTGFLAFFVARTPYLQGRLRIFLDPLSDIQNLGYQVYQAFLAIGSGGLFGRGFGKSQQKLFYLPEVSSDSIFAIIAEELGFVVVTLLIILFLVVMQRGLRIAFHAEDPFGRFMAAGITAWITFQTFLNTGVMTGLAPLTGIPLPFISAGGSSMLINLAATGILVNISKYNSSH